MSKKAFASSQIALASCLGISPRTVQVSLAKGAPRRTRRGFSVTAWRAWRAARPGRGTGPIADPTLLAATTRKVSAEASLREMDLAVKRREFIPAALAAERLDRMAYVFAGVLERAETQLSKALVGLEAGKVGSAIVAFFAPIREELAGRWEDLREFGDAAGACASAGQG